MITDIFIEFIKSLQKFDTKYLVVGGYSLAFHGMPRFTQDFDLWLEVSDSNSLKLLEALNDFGFGSLGLSKDDFKNPNNIIQLGYPPNRIDLIMQIDGVKFDDAYNNK
jgi:hypothetical protein